MSKSLHYKNNQQLSDVGLTLESSTPNEIDSIRKIVVKFPQSNSSLMVYYPFLFGLSETYPKAEIYGIFEEGSDASFWLNFLPFFVKAYERPKIKRSLPGTHQFCVNIHEIFNVDLFFDLEGTLNSAFMGLNFRAKKRIGFIKGVNKFLLTDKIPYINFQSLEAESIYILEKFSRLPMSELRVQRPLGLVKEEERSHKIEDLFKVPDPPKFILIFVKDFHQLKAEEEMWSKIFLHFEHQKFIIFSLAHHESVADFFSKISQQNEVYMNYGQEDFILKYLLQKVCGVITNFKNGELLCRYFGVESFVLSEENSANHITQNVFWRHRSHYLCHEENKVYKIIDQSGIVKGIENFNQVVDHLYFCMNL